MGHLDLSMRKTLRVVGLLTVMIFLQRKKITTCEVKDEKEQTVFCLFVFFDGVQSTESYPSI